MRKSLEKLQPEMSTDQAQRILARHGTHISVEEAELMLNFLRKLSKLAVRALLDRAGANI
jgi:hypothetical protein